MFCHLMMQFECDQQTSRVFLAFNHLQESLHKIVFQLLQLNQMTLQQNPNHLIKSKSNLGRLLIDFDIFEYGRDQVTSDFSWDVPLFDLKPNSTNQHKSPINLL